MENRDSKLLIFILYLVAYPALSVGQILEDSVINDIDGLIYKTINQETKGTTYYDVNGNIRILSNSKNDTLEDRHLREISKIVVRDLIIPPRYVQNSTYDNFKSTLGFAMSFLVEENGEVSNLRLIGDLPVGIQPKEVFPREFTLPKLEPEKNENGTLIVVERVTDVFISCLCSPPTSVNKAKPKRGKRKQ